MVALPTLPDEYLRVRRAFGCAIEAAEFRLHFDALPVRDRARLVRVAQRVLMAGAIRYRVRGRLSINHPSETVAFHDVLFHAAELPSLEVFYLFGCLDTLAKSRHMKFDEWLNSSITHDQSGLAGRALSVSEIVSLYKTYEDEQGVGANLRRLFQALPPAATAWLAHHVRFVPMGEETPSLDEVVQGPTDLLLHLYHYFYGLRRNPFAHESVSQITDVERDIKAGQGWHVLIRNVSSGKRPADFWAHRKGGKDWMAYLRNGIDEATVLRVIVYGAALQRLDIEVTEARVSAFVASLSRQSALYGFLDEIQRNALLLSWWPMYGASEGEAWQARLDRTPMPQLASYWAAALIGRYNVGYPLEQGLKRWTEEYREAIMQINHEITAFETRFPPTGGNESNGRRQALAEFVQAQVSTQSYSLVAQTPFHPSVNHVRHVADDPCYT